MTRVTLLAGVIVLVMLGIAACGGDGERTATGVIVDVQASSLSQLDSFTLRTNDGETLVFVVAPDAPSDVDEGLFPSHLRSHAVVGEQVAITYEEREGEVQALRLEHAGER